MEKANLTISTNQKSIEFDLEKVTRETEVGRKQIIYKDLNNNSLKKASITSDGMNIILTGNMKENYVDSKDNYIEHERLVSVDYNWNEVKLIDKNDKEEKKLNLETDIFEIFNYKIVSVYILNPRVKNSDYNELYDLILKSFKEGTIYIIPLNTRDSSINNEGILIPLENNNILIEIGYFNKPRFFSRKEAIEEIIEEEEEPEDYDVAELFEEAF